MQGLIVLILAILFIKQVTILTLNYFSFKSLTKINIMQQNENDQPIIDSDFAITLVTKNRRFMRRVIDYYGSDRGDSKMRTNERNQTLVHDNFNNFTLNNTYEYEYEEEEEEEKVKEDEEDDKEEDISFKHIPGQCNDDFKQLVL